MPTFDVLLDSFWQDFGRLSRAEQDLFISVKEKFIEDVDSGQFRASLRVKPMRGRPGIWEMSWRGNDGRATFQYGTPVKPGMRHIIWRRIGGHEIFSAP